MHDTFPEEMCSADLSNIAPRTPSTMIYTHALNQGAGGSQSA